MLSRCSAVPWWTRELDANRIWIGSYLPNLLSHDKDREDLLARVDARLGNQYRRAGSPHESQRSLVDLVTQSSELPEVSRSDDLPRRGVGDSSSALRLLVGNFVKTALADVAEVDLVKPLLRMHPTSRRWYRCGRGSYSTS